MGCQSKQLVVLNGGLKLAQILHESLQDTAKVSINQGSRLSSVATSKLNGKSLMGVPSELKTALWANTDLLKQALWFSLAINLLMLAPTVYMMQVYDMVLNSQSMRTLLMMLLLVLIEILLLT